MILRFLQDKEAILHPRWGELIYFLQSKKETMTASYPSIVLLEGMTLLGKHRAEFRPSSRGLLTKYLASTCYYIRLCMRRMRGRRRCHCLVHDNLMWIWPTVLFLMVMGSCKSANTDDLTSTLLSLIQPAHMVIVTGHWYKTKSL